MTRFMQEVQVKDAAIIEDSFVNIFVAGISDE